MGALAHNERPASGSRTSAVFAFGLAQHKLGHFRAPPLRGTLSLEKGRAGRSPGRAIY